MQPIGPMQWVLLAIYVFAIAFPVAKILRRLGFSGWWTILAFVPLANVLGLWALAYARWSPRGDTPVEVQSREPPP